jgi:hypothetical protein
MSIVVLESAPSPISVTVPEAPPFVLGRNSAAKVVLWPPDSVNGSDSPDTLNPVPDVTAFIIFTSAAPVLDRRTLCEYETPDTTCPNEMKVGVAWTTDVLDVF